MVALVVALWWSLGGLVIDERLGPAWAALVAARTASGAEIGEQHRRLAELTVTAIVVEPLPAGLEAGWDGPRRRIVVAERIVGEDPRALAAVLAHEITHAVQDDRRRRGMDLLGADCVGREVEAFQAQASVWRSFWSDGDLPSGTDLERLLTEAAEIDRSDPWYGLRGWLESRAGYGERCAQAAS